MKSARWWTSARTRPSRFTRTRSSAWPRRPRKSDAEDGEENNRQAIELDEKFDEGVEVFLLCGRASTSLLQRRMGLGYTRAAKLCDQMEARGIVGPDRGPKGRELLITQEQWDEFKRIRANAPGGTPGSDSAWGPKGSKDNPITPAERARGTPSPVKVARASSPVKKNQTPRPCPLKPSPRPAAHWAPPPWQFESGAGSMAPLPDCVPKAKSPTPRSSPSFHPLTA